MLILRVCFITCYSNDICTQGSWGGIVGNPVKLGLSVLSLGLDACFFWQHCAYGRGLYDHIDEEPTSIRFLIDDDIGRLVRPLSDDEDTKSE